MKDTENITILPTSCLDKSALRIGAGKVKSRKDSRTRKRRKFTGNQYKKKDEESQQENPVTDGYLLPATEETLSLKKQWTKNN